MNTFNQILKIYLKCHMVINVYIPASAFHLLLENHMPEMGALFALSVRFVLPTSDRTVGAICWYS